MKSFIRNILIGISLVAGSHAASIAEGAWVMSIESVTEPPIIAILEKKNDQNMVVTFDFFRRGKVAIPLKVSASPGDPSVLILSGSVQLTEDQKVQLLAFHGEFTEGAGAGRLAIIGEKAEIPKIDFGMRNLDQLVAEADRAIKADAGEGESTTRTEPDSESGDQP